ncbi:MAG: hypothetical protein JXM71_11420 [Spirochaetales bacterium]|nr:hypothetical protein [Spirochaetales bacterium]
MRSAQYRFARFAAVMSIVASVAAAVSCSSPLMFAATGTVVVDFGSKADSRSDSRAGSLPADVASVVITVKADDFDDIVTTLSSPGLSASI